MQTSPEAGCFSNGADQAHVGAIGLALEPLPQEMQRGAGEGDPGSCLSIPPAAEKVKLAFNSSKSNSKSSGEALAGCEDSADVGAIGLVLEPSPPQNGPMAPMPSQQQNGPNTNAFGWRGRS